MERFNRMLQAAHGMGMGAAAPGAVSGLASPFSLRRLPRSLRRDFQSRRATLANTKNL